MKDSEASPPCPASDDIIALVEGRLSPERVRLVEEHADECLQCQMLIGVAAQTRTDADAISRFRKYTGADEIAALERGDTVGRYLVLGTLGAGGMGVVHSAYDPELDRRVALKLLLPSSLQPASSGRGRLLREAQAMAKLSHPNVVAVHDVGTVGERVYVAMEFVDGTTLTRWLAERERPWSEVVQVFVAAGRGLAAAHEKGLIHRDFKCENVMIDAEGRVRVMDFGLARADRVVDGVLVETTRPNHSALSSDLTAAGSVIGTPAYMAPEQFAGAATDARTDQFSFCVALWEGLYGERPFGGNSYEALRDAVRTGARRAPPAGRKVPKYVRQALERGLAINPDERWPSMDALLLVLSREPWKRRGFGFAAAASFVAVGIGVAAVNDRSRRLCTGAAEAIASAWGPSRRGEVEAAILATSAPYARDAWASLGPQLDAWTQTWSRMHTETCEATRVRGEQSEALMDLQMACLSRARLQLEATTVVLARATPETVARTQDIVAALPELRRCADVDALRTGVPQPQIHEIHAVESIVRDLAEARALGAAGEFDEALAAAERAAAALENVRYEPVQTQVWLELAGRLRDSGRFDEAEHALVTAQELAARLGQRDELHKALVLMMYVVSGDRARHDEALAFRSVLRGLAGEDATRRSEVASAVAGVLLAKGRYPEAEAEAREALALWEGGAGDAAKPVHLRENLALLLMAQGRYADAEAELRTLLDEQIASLGAQHPDTARSRSHLASALFYRNQLAEAEAEHRAALEVRVRALGPEHVLVAHSRHGIANALRAQGKLSAAELELRRAIEALIETHGEHHPDLAHVRNTLAATLSELGKLDEAELEFRAVLASRIAALGADHPEVARTHHNLGKLLRMRQELEEAEAELRTAVAIREVKLRVEHPDLGRSLLELGEVLLARDVPREAATVASRAWSIFEAAGGHRRHMAAAGFIEARAISLREPGRARTRARAALQLLVDDGDIDSALRRKLEAWLRGAGEPPHPVATADRAPE